VQVETEYTELSLVNTGVSQGCVLRPLVCLLYTADLPTSTGSTIATFVNVTAVLATDNDTGNASQKLETKLDAIQK
jgi:hypothetical protein